MKLHQLGLQRDIGRRLAPPLSKFIHFIGGTNFLRKLIAYLNYLIGRGSGASWNIEAEVNAALSCIHRSEAVVFDVGANIGKWSDAFRRNLRSGHLFLFEPQAECQQRIQALHLENARLIGCAVGRESSRRSLYTSSETDGSASLSQRLDSFFEDSDYSTIEVEVLKLDDFVRSENIDFVDYIKFDIEGHELEALEGLGDTLQRKAVGAFSIEFGSGNLNSKTCFRDFWNLLSPNYTLSIITPGGHRFEFREYYEDWEYYRGVSNFIAILKDHPFRRTGGPS